MCRFLSEGICFLYPGREKKGQAKLIRNFVSRYMKSS